MSSMNPGETPASPPPQGPAKTVASVEDIQQAWHDLTLRVSQLEADRAALEHENKALRSLLERVVSYRQKSHNELILILTTLVGKLPINDVGVIVGRLVEHNTNVNQSLAALVKGAAEADLPQPEVLRTLDQIKRDLAAALKPVIEDLIKLDTPLEAEALQSLAAQPDLFFTPQMVRANRCFAKAYVPRERILREFGEPAIAFFNDMTTDAKRNPFPKAEEILLEFKPEFEAALPQNNALAPEKKESLLTLHRKVQRTKAPTEEARLQKNAFFRLSFLIELLHYYEHQATESSEVIFAKRLPGLVEQLVLAGPGDTLDEKPIALAESLLAFVVSPEHRLMVVNNIGKGGAGAKTLKFVLLLRAGKASDTALDDVIAEFVKHLVPAPPALPPKESLLAILRLVNPAAQLLVVKALMSWDRLRKEQAESLARALAADLGLQGLREEPKITEAERVRIEGIRAWAKIKDLISKRGDATTIAAAIRERLNAKFDADELKQSWLALTEADTIALIKIVCHFPYLPDGRTDAIARPVLESYFSRLTHEKYAATYGKVVKSLKSMFAAKPDNPTLRTFVALVRWVDPEAAARLAADVGMPLPA